MFYWIRFPICQCSKMNNFEHCHKRSLCKKSHFLSIITFYGSFKQWFNTNDDEFGLSDPFPRKTCIWNTENWRFGHICRAKKTKQISDCFYDFTQECFRKFLQKQNFSEINMWRHIFYVKLILDLGPAKRNSKFFHSEA